MNKSLKRIMAVLLLICMMGMNLSTIGIYGITYALSEDEISKAISHVSEVLGKKFLNKMLRLKILM